MDAATTHLLPTLVLGFALGMRHATDPDHVVAVSTIVSRERKLLGSSLVGALWGVGHTVTLLAVGGAIVVFDVAVPARLALAMELCVAVMLFALGFANLFVGSADRASRAAPVRARPLLVGVVHGLSGSAAITLLIVPTIGTVGWSAVYLLIFGVGTVAGMMALTTAIAAPFAYTAERLASFREWLARGTGVASIAFGAVVAYRVIAVYGLFASVARAIPE